MRRTIIIDQSISIATTLETVFTFACDYRNDTSWRSGVREMAIDSRGDTHAGDRTQEIMRILGRTTRTEAIITAHEPNSHTAFRTVAGDLTANGYRRTKPAGGKTVFTYHAEALLDRPLRLFAGPIERLFNRRAAKDLRTLAELLSQQAYPLSSMETRTRARTTPGSERTSR